MERFYYKGYKICVWWEDMKDEDTEDSLAFEKCISAYLDLFNELPQTKKIYFDNGWLDPSLIDKITFDEKNKEITFKLK
jgi:hypothetical protein